MSNHDPDYYDEDGDLADHIHERIWEEGSAAARQAWGFTAAITKPCPYEQDSQEWAAWWRGFDYTYFKENH